MSGLANNLQPHHNHIAIHQTKDKYECMLEKRVVPLLCAVGISGLLLFVVWNGLSAYAQGVTQRRTVFLLDNSPSVRTGEGAVDGKPSDPEDLRLRLARFAVQALRTMTTTQKQHVGVVSFGEITNTLVPLLPASTWSNVELAQVTEQTEVGSGSNFSKALAEAQAMLTADGDNTCSSTDQQCDIILISDGTLQPGRDTQPLTEILESLRSLNINIHVLTFQNPGAESDKIWQTFEETHLIQTYQIDIIEEYERSPKQVYKETFEILGIASLFERFDIFVTPHVITYPIHTFPTWVNWQIIADVAAWPDFSLDGKDRAPNVSGSDYLFWRLPLRGIWQIKIDEPGVIFVRPRYEVMPVTLQLQPRPEALTTEQELSTTVKLVAGHSLVVEDIDAFRLVANLEGPLTATIPMSPTQDAGFLLQRDALVPGSYILTVKAIQSPKGLVVNSITRTFQVNKPDAISRSLPDFTITPSGPLSSGTWITATANISLDERSLDLLAVNTTFTSSTPMTEVTPGQVLGRLVLTETSALLIESVKEGTRSRPKVIEILEKVSTPQKIPLLEDRRLWRSTLLTASLCLFVGIALDHVISSMGGSRNKLREEETKLVVREMINDITHEVIKEMQARTIKAEIADTNIRDQMSNKLLQESLNRNGEINIKVSCDIRDQIINYFKEKGVL
jgi:hypothetical protein